MFITIENINKKYYEKQLFDNASYTINKKDKIGVVGVNGVGKTTLLKMIAKLDNFDSGLINYMNNLSISYLEQEPKFDENLTIHKHIISELEKLNRLEDEYEVTAILNKLNITDLNQQISELSGGQKKRVALAVILVKKTDLLILDEPTNHLDNAMIVWLEEFLIKYTGTILMVTHDRYFLDRVTTKILEIDNQQIYNHPTNYSGFVTRKLEREEMEIATNRKQSQILKREQEWMNQGVKARGTKSRGRMERFYDLKEQVKTEKTSELEMISSTTRTGSKLIELKSISKSFGSKKIISDFSYQVQKLDRIGIVGNNGNGKSTLLKLIAKDIELDSGTIEIGQTMKIGFFRQEAKELDENMRVIDYIKSIANFIKTDKEEISASQMCERFLFNKDMQYHQIKYLSGGEKRRLYLLSILIEAPNVLFLDEPTNDLDIQTLGILEDYLEEYNGIVITVSHDRYFLDRVVDKIFELDGTGDVKIYNGGYSTYFDKTKLKSAKKESSKPKTEKIKPKNNRTIKFSYNEQREYETIDQDIEDLEQKLEKLDKELAANGSYFDKVMELSKKREAAQNELDHKNERWFYLMDIAEQIQMQKEGK